MTNVTRFELETRTTLFIRCPSCGSVLFYLIHSEAYIFTLLCDGCGTEFGSKITETGSMILIQITDNEDQSCLSL